MSTAPAEHPAVFSDTIMAQLFDVLTAEADDVAALYGRPMRVLDPMAGIGTIHRLAGPDVTLDHNTILRADADNATRALAAAKPKTHTITRLAAAPDPPLQVAQPLPRLLDLRQAEQALLLPRDSRNDAQAEAASRYAVLGAEISYLQATVVALRNQQRAMVMPQFMTAPPAPPTPPGYPQPRNVPMETIMSDQPIPAAVRAPQEQAVLVPAAVQAGPPTSIQVPVPELPYVPGRAGGGALGMNVDSDPDEDEHLKSSAMAGGQWV